MLTRFYEARAYTPAWLEDGHPTRQAEEAVLLLERAAEKGLSSADYDAPLLAAKLTNLRAEQRATPSELALFDAALTLALLRYTTNLAHGRVNPRSLYLDLDSNKRNIDVVALLQRGIERNQVAAETEAAEPQLPMYAALKKSLAQYRRLAADQTLPVVPTAKSKVEPGATFAGIPQLQRRLVAFGDLDPAAPERDDGDKYDDELVNAVKRFQERHGLTADGVLGSATVQEVNRPLSERVRQIEMGIERIRWLPPAPAERFIVINIPRFKLLSFDGAIGTDRPLMEMDVIVGSAGRTPTPVFADQVEYVDFSPYWNVPRSITLKELLPKLKRDPGYLARQGMEIVGAGVTTSVDASTLAELERGTVRLRQRPGAKNALGGVKFVFPNRYDVYLHSTPAHELFSRTRRDFSHGCIRVEDPVAVAEFVLFDRPDWDAERIRRSMSLPEPVRVTLERPIPILIFYTTAVVDPQGRTHFLPDIYGHDKKLAEALNKAPTALP
ncbi:MAG: L,D-transpeptidase family protein [Vicinamibacterales bacterium]